jgi:hypothetical protein
MINNIKKTKKICKDIGWTYDDDIKNILLQYESDNFVLLGVKSENYFFRDSEENKKKFISPKLLKKNFFYSLVLLINNNHWVCILIEIIKKNSKKECKIEYFDPIGNKPSNNMERIIKLISLNISISFDCDKVEFKYSNIDIQKNKKYCGIWILDYLIKRITNTAKNIDKYIDEILLEYKKNDNYIINIEKKLFLK